MILAYHIRPDFAKLPDQSLTISLGIAIDSMEPAVWTIVNIWGAFKLKNL